MPLTRRLILQKARHHPTKKGAMTDCKHTVSGTISLPSRGTFHPSLTVLTTLSVTPSIQAYRVVPADSQQIPRARCYSGKIRTHPNHMSSGTGLSPSTAGDSTPLPLTHNPGCQPVVASQTHASHNPLHATPTKYHPRIEFSHNLRLRSPLLTESHIVFFSYGY